VTEDSALVWARASAEASMHAEYMAVSESGRRMSQRRETTTIRIDGASDFIGQFELNDLEPDTMYVYQVIAHQGNDRAQSEVASFRYSAFGMNVELVACSGVFLRRS
jgi:phosphodiesterase/alkaline phosphatase D-like protein